MINKEFTNIYLSNFDLLTEAVYLCWKNSFCNETEQLNKTKLKEQIRSYGLYDHKHAIKKEVPINFTINFQFKTLTWVNKFSEEVSKDTLCEYVELYQQVINEIEDNLFKLKLKPVQIAYANTILRCFDKNYLSKRNFDNVERNIKYHEVLELILNRRFIFEDKSKVHTDNCNEVFPNYDLSIRMINHLGFIDKLIELFFCFDINLVLLAEQAKYNLYIFKNESDSSNLLNESNISNETNSHQDNEIPKFISPLSDECLIKIMHYLSHKKKHDNQNTDIWLFWFNRRCIKVTEPLNWKGSATMLSNVIQHLCGESISSTIKVAFDRSDYVKPTRKEYLSSKMHKEIEQIITVSKQNK